VKSSIQTAESLDEVESSLHRNQLSGMLPENDEGILFALGGKAESVYERVFTLHRFSHVLTIILEGGYLLMDLLVCVGLGTSVVWKYSGNWHWLSVRRRRPRNYFIIL
jgi:hypothetical protein